MMGFWELRIVVDGETAAFHPFVNNPGADTARATLKGTDNAASIPVAQRNYFLFKDGAMTGATADGRHAGEFFSSSLAPSHDITVRGPLSVLQSFGKIHYRRICNGGPLTMELSDTLFRGRDAAQKVALFIRAFVQSGCQQLQLNTLDVDTLRNAQRHPESHRNLVVRVWGWSGYFCELYEAYQNQIIGRHIYGA